jgi:hypothetical protein
MELWIPVEPGEAEQKLGTFLESPFAKFDGLSASARQEPAGVRGRVASFSTHWE